MVALGESPQPLYLRVYRLIADEIAGGALEPGDRLPSERELTGRLGVSRATVRRALGELATDGLVTASANRGSFVASGPLVEPPNALLSFTELGGQPAVGFGRWTRDDTPPATTTLSSGWPNPFRATITFQYQARVPGFLHLHVRDIRGRRVTTVERTALSAGIGQISWDGRDDAGQSVPAGIYFVTLVAADGARDSRKVVLLH